MDPVTPQVADGWTRDPATLEQILITTLAQRDWRGVEAAMTLLAFADPHRAQLLYDTMRVGLHLASGAP